MSPDPEAIPVAQVLDSPAGWTHHPDTEPCANCGAPCSLTNPAGERRHAGGCTDYRRPTT